MEFEFVVQQYPVMLHQRHPIIGCSASLSKPGGIQTSLAQALPCHGWLADDPWRKQAKDVVIEGFRYDVLYSAAK